MSDFRNMTEEALLEQLRRFDQVAAARCLLDVARVGEVKTYLNATGRLKTTTPVKKETSNPSRTLPSPANLRALIQEFRLRKRVVDVIHLLDRLDTSEIQQRIDLVDGAIGHQSLVAVRSNTPERRTTPKKEIVAMEVESYTSSQQRMDQDSSDQGSFADDQNSGTIEPEYAGEILRAISSAGANRSRLNVKAMTLKELCLHCVSHKVISNKERTRYLQQAKHDKNVNLHCYLGRKLVSSRPNLYFQDAGMPQLHRRKMGKKIQRAYQGKNPDVESDNQVQIISRQKFYKEGGKKSSKKHARTADRGVARTFKAEDLRKHSSKNTKTKISVVQREQRVRKFKPKSIYSSDSD